jgi:hypothetical protein
MGVILLMPIWQLLMTQLLDRPIQLESPFSSC